MKKSVLIGLAIGGWCTAVGIAWIVFAVFDGNLPHFIAMGIAAIVIGLTVGISIATFGPRKEVEKAKEKSAQILMEQQKSFSAKKIQFYEELVTLKCTDLSNIANKERAKLVAKKYLNVSSDVDFNAFFVAAKEEYTQKVNKEKQQEKQQKLMSMKRNETSFYEESRKFAFLYGRDKRKKYYLLEAVEYLDKADEYEANAKLAMTAIRSADHLAGVNKNWAIAGGIADAIAGPAAGIMVASDIQNQNASAKQKSNEIKNFAAQAVVEQQNMAEEMKEKAEQLEAIAAQIDLKLLEEGDPEEFFNLINPKIKEQRVTETGSVRATIKINAAKTKIYKTVDAYIDGTIKAEIKKDNEIVGEILFCLPRDGSTRAVTIDGICPSLHDANAKYELLLKPNKLWAIEV